MLPDVGIMPILRACCGLSAVPVLPAGRADRADCAARVDCADFNR